MNEYMNLRVRYLDYLGMPQEGIIIDTIPGVAYDVPYLIIQDVVPEHNNKLHALIQGSVPYAELRLSTEVELL